MAGGCSRATRRWLSLGVRAAEDFATELSDKRVRKRVRWFVVDPTNAPPHFREAEEFADGAHAA
jgi:hypothetical protein